MQYVLNADHSVERMDDVVEWAKRFELDNRVVAKDQIGDTMISTVFLGIQHGTSRDGKPLLFETMVFKGPCNGQCWRWPTYHDAEEGHKRALGQVRTIMGV